MEALQRSPKAGEWSWFIEGADGLCGSYAGWLAQGPRRKRHEAIQNYDLEILVQKLVQNAPNTPFCDV